LSDDATKQKPPFHEVACSQLAAHVGCILGLTNDSPEQDWNTCFDKMAEDLTLIKGSHIPESARPTLLTAVHYARNQMFCVVNLPPDLGTLFDETIAALTPPDTGQVPLDLGAPATAEPVQDGPTTYDEAHAANPAPAPGQPGSKISGPGC